MKPLVISEITGDEEELSAEDVFASILTVLRSMQRPKEFSANDTTLSFGGYLMDVESLVLQGDLRANNKITLNCANINAFGPLRENNCPADSYGR